MCIVIGNIFQFSYVFVDNVLVCLDILYRVLFIEIYIEIML